MGLRKYGKGDWRNISRNFVVTRTPTQVASHAQKYFIRQLSGRKDKRRASIHDITTVALETQTCAPSSDNKRPDSQDQSLAMQSHQNSQYQANQGSFQWAQRGGNAAAAMAFNSMLGGESVFLSSPYAGSPYGMEVQGHN